MTMFAQSTPKSYAFLTHDNDFFNLLNPTDRYYSFGLIGGYQRVLKGDKPKFLSEPSPTKLIGGLKLAQKGYTPTREDAREGQVQERPFAGTLTMSAYLTSVNNKRIFRFDLEVGVRGPAAKAGEVQNWLHSVFGDYYVEGWENQLPNKALFNLYGFYAKPFTLSGNSEIIPESSVALGNHFTYLQQGITFRIGKFNPISYSSYYATHISNQNESKNLEFFGTVTLYGRFTLVNATLSDSYLIDDRPMISNESLGAGLELKFHLLFHGTGLTLGYTTLTPETNLSKDHGYGSIGLSYSW